ncbi:heme NO-binding domain-containing protein [Kaarinaea lacus]
MYGVIFHFLRNYVIDKHGGKDTWRTILKANGHAIDDFNPITEYPDTDVIKLANTAAVMLKVPLVNVLEDFGVYTGKQLVTFYHMYVKKEWKTFDVIENAGSKIHQAINHYNTTRKPPHIDARRMSPDHLEIHYHSTRKLCPVLKGIVQGIAEHYNERFIVQETQCMHAGASECIINVHRAK